MPKISLMWRHFDKINKTSATCKVCGKHFKTGGNTTNLYQHLHVHHLRLGNLEQAVDVDNPEDVSKIFKSYVTYSMYHTLIHLLKVIIYQLVRLSTVNYNCHQRSNYLC